MTRAARLSVAVALLVGAGIARADAPRDEPAAIDVDREVVPAGRTELGFDGGAPVDGWGLTASFGYPVSYTHLTLPTNREV